MSQEQTTITVDRDRCMAHGICTELAPDVFESAEDGYVSLLKSSVTSSEARAAVLLAEASCPMRAITVHQQSTGQDSSAKEAT